MGRREENFELRKAVQGVRHESRALEKKLDTIIGMLVHTNRKGDLLMADFSALRAVVEEMKKDLVDAVERLKNLPTVEDPAVQAEIDSIVADLTDADKKYDDAVAGAAAAEPSTSVTGDKLEPVVPTDEEQIDPYVPEDATPSNPDEV
jgi:hypothetical protein